MVAAFFWNIAKTANRPAEWYSALTISVILLAAVTAGVMTAQKGLARINRIRARSASESETNQKTQTRLRIVLVALTVLWGVIDAAVLWMIFQDTFSLWLAPVSLFGLTFGLGVIALCAYQSAARSEIRTVARLCLTVLIISLVVTLFLWLRLVWFRSN